MPALRSGRCPSASTRRGGPERFSGGTRSAFRYLGHPEGFRLDRSWIRWAERERSLPSSRGTWPSWVSWSSGWRVLISKGEGIRCSAGYPGRTGSDGPTSIWTTIYGSSGCSRRASRGERPSARRGTAQPRRGRPNHNGGCSFPRPSSVLPSRPPGTTSPSGVSQKRRTATPGTS